MNAYLIQSFRGVLFEFINADATLAYVIEGKTLDCLICENWLTFLSAEWSR